MGGLLAALAGLATPILARVLVALGMSAVTVTGVTLAWSALRSQLLVHIGGLPAATVQFLGLAGFWVALGMIFGAVSFVVALWALGNVVRIAGTAAP
jgi:hypothetical protein